MCVISLLSLGGKKGLLWGGAGGFGIRISVMADSPEREYPWIYKQDVAAHCLRKRRVTYRRHELLSTLPQGHCYFRLIT